MAQVTLGELGTELPNPTFIVLQVVAKRQRKKGIGRKGNRKRASGKKANEKKQQ
jgi:hypothetical protein